MKNIRFLTFVLAIATVVLSACGATAATPSAAPEAAVNTNTDTMPVAFVGIVDSITGDQWVISGTTVTVDASIIRNGPFSVGDQVKVEGFVNPDGSFTVSRLETPSPKETATSAPFDDNSNDALVNGNTNDTNVNDDNSNGANINDDNSNSANVNDDNSNSANSNDDSSANVNDDNSNSTNSNDNSSSANTNDDKGGSSSNDNGSGGGGSNSNDG
jgi:hypothetical protein